MSRNLVATDRRFSKLIRTRDGFCQGVGARVTLCGGELQTAHTVGRRYLAVRWHPMNARALCLLHADYFTAHPKKWREFTESHGPPTLWTYDEAHHAALSLPVPTVADVIEVLEQLEHA